jgi:hypothetical protein
LLEANVGCLVIFILLVGLPFVALGGFFIYIGYDEMREQARLNDNTVEVQAKILSSGVRRSTTRTGPGTGSTTSDYWPDIKFSYDYGGESRTSTKVWAVGVGGSEAEARAVQQRYPQDAAVSAFVDPENPETAFLERRWSHEPYLSVVMGVFPLAFVTGLGILLAGWKRPQLASAIAALVGSLILVCVFQAGGHYLRLMPEPDRHWGMMLVFGLCLPMAMIPFAALWKARQLHRLYKEGMKELANG